MNIGIKLNKDDFMYDVHSLVKSFYPDDDVSIFTEDDREKCALQRNLLFELTIPDYRDRKAAKDALKKDLYHLLTALTGQSLPWGTLSGIRPTKIPMKMLDQAEAGGRLMADPVLKEEISHYMKETYETSDDKIDLAIRVASEEKKLLAPLKLGDSSYSLYVNIPFCPSICLYCTFASSPIDRWADRIEGYLDTVIREMLATRDRLAQKGYPAKPTTVYFGGGTPTALSADQLDRLISRMKEIWDFQDLEEFTVEAGRPDSITADKLQVLKKHGVSRISVNPQTMNQKTLDLIGRDHTVGDVRAAFDLARKIGFDNINMDMILGLPGEGREEVLTTLEEIQTMDPDSLTVHSLAIKRASRLKQTIREDREKDGQADYGNFEGLVFENSEDLMDLAGDCADRLGMVPYYLYRQKNMRGNLENTGFARPGKACLYNILIMEEKQSILAFGAGASTKRVTGGGRIDRIVNPKNVEVYMEKWRDLVKKKAALF